MIASISKKTRLLMCLWLLGMVGVVSILPVIPRLVALQPAPAVSLQILQLISAIQSGVLVFATVMIGGIFAEKVNLSAPLIAGLFAKNPILPLLKRQFIPALLGGVVGGFAILFILAQSQPYLPTEFLMAAEKLQVPWYARFFYGGITEELLIRWGLMSFLVWMFYRIFQQTSQPVKSPCYIAAIVISATVFALGHLPVAHLLSPVVSVPLVIYIIAGNASFGLIAGGLFWKWGLECAMFAHMIAHVVMILFASIFS